VTRNQKLFGGYILEERITRGGMAEVYLATRQGPEGFNKQVAIKRILDHLTDQADFRTMFLDEGRLVAQLSHPNIVQIFDMGEVDDRLFLAMEFIDGLNLAQVLKICRSKGVRLPVRLACHIAKEAALGLDYAHNFKDKNDEALNIIHRDISPQNIMLTHDGVVKIVDFGIAKAATNLYRTQTVSIKGKLRYMSPEQIETKIKLDRRTDVYSTGVVLFEMLTMQAPHQATSDLELMTKIVRKPAPDPREFVSDLSANLARIVNHSLERNRKNRFPDCRQLQVALLEHIRKNSAPVDNYDLSEFLNELTGHGHSPAEKNKHSTASAIMPDSLDYIGKGSTAPKLRRNDPAGGGGSKTIWIGLTICLSIASLLVLWLLAEGGPGTAKPTKQSTFQELNFDRATIDKKRAEASFFSHWNRGRRFAKDPAMIYEALKEMEKAAELDGSFELDEKTRKNLQARLAEIRAGVIDLERQNHEALKRADQAEIDQKKQHQNDLRILKKREQERKELITSVMTRSTEYWEKKAEAAKRRPSTEQQGYTNPVIMNYVNAGVRSLTEGRPKKAITMFRSALAFSPKTIEIYFLLAEAYNLDNNGPLAYEYYRLFIEECPKCTGAASVKLMLREDFENWHILVQDRWTP